LRTRGGGRRREGKSSSKGRCPLDRRGGEKGRGEADPGIAYKKEREEGRLFNLSASKAAQKRKGPRMTRRREKTSRHPAGKKRLSSRKRGGKAIRSRGKRYQI